jgi:hypothetical protein
LIERKFRQGRETIWLLKQNIGPFLWSVRSNYSGFAPPQLFVRFCPTASEKTEQLAR